MFNCVRLKVVQVHWLCSSESSRKVEIKMLYEPILHHLQDANMHVCHRPSLSSEFELEARHKSVPIKNNLYNWLIEIHLCRWMSVNSSTHLQFLWLACYKHYTEFEYKVERADKMYMYWELSMVQPKHTQISINAHTHTCWGGPTSIQSHLIRLLYAINARYTVVMELPIKIQFRAIVRHCSCQLNAPKHPNALNNLECYTQHVPTCSMHCVCVLWFSFPIQFNVKQIKF